MPVRAVARANVVNLRSPAAAVRLGRGRAAGRRRGRGRLRGGDRAHAGGGGGGLLWLWRPRTRCRCDPRRAAVGPTEPVARPLLRDAWPQSLQIGLRAGLVLLLTPLCARPRRAPRRRVQHHHPLRHGRAVRVDRLRQRRDRLRRARRWRQRRGWRGTPGSWAACRRGCSGPSACWLMIAFAAVLVGWCLPPPRHDRRWSRSPQTTSPVAGWSQVAGGRGARGDRGRAGGSGRMRAPLRRRPDRLRRRSIGGCAGLVARAAAADAIYAALVAGMAGGGAAAPGLVALGRWARPD
jgi:hypothetical protein